MTYKILGLLTGGLLLLAPASAMAARVSVEIEGQSVIQAPAVVDTAASVSKPGGAACAGAAPATALETAVNGDWDGGAFSVERIKGENRPIAPGASSWALYVNNSFWNGTACDTTLKDGDKVLFFWSNAFASEGYDEPVVLDAPTIATPGVPFTVTAKDLTTDFTTYPSPPSAQTPAAGATVSGGTAPATVGADGTAQVAVNPGPYTLVVTHGNRAPARVAGCATTGHDGLCGTNGPSPPIGGENCPPLKANAASVHTVKARAASCAVSPDTRAALSRIQGIKDHQKFAKGKGPRTLRGKTDPDTSGIADIRLRLTRTDRGKCTTYDGKTEKWKAMKKCGADRGAYFSAGDKGDWTYLLPSRLGRGRYVLDVVVVDKLGHKTEKLARGTSRVVFTVA